MVVVSLLAKIFAVCKGWLLHGNKELSVAGGGQRERGKCYAERFAIW